MITYNGAKMSKSTGNVVNPDFFDPDELRMCLMFIGPYSEGGDWNEGGIKGVSKFLRKIRSWLGSVGSDDVDIDSLRETLDRRVRSMQFNTAVSDWMKFYNSNKANRPNLESSKAIYNMLNCFTPNP